MLTNTIAGRRASIVACLLVVCGTRSADAQSEVAFGFYHGRPSESSWVTASANDTYTRLDAARLSLHLPAGSRVCVNIINGHPVNYAYGLGVSVDSSSPALPDLSKQVALLSALFKPTSAGPELTIAARDVNPSQDLRGQRMQASREMQVLQDSIQRLEAAADSRRRAVENLIDSLRNLESDVAAARGVVAASDLPERLSQVNAPRSARAGLRFAQDSLAAFPQSPGRFGDRDLKKTIESWVKTARQAAKGDTVFEAAVTGIGGYADGLRETAEQLLKSIGSASTRPRVCESVSKGTTTLTLKASQKDSSAAKARILGKQEVFTIVNDAPMDRKRVEVHPVALGVVAPGESEFFVENGLLRADHAALMWRPAVLVDGLLGAARDGQMAAYAGVGIATAAKDAPISDVFASLNVDFFNVLRVGVGAGGSNVPVHVKNFVVGDKFPTDKKLEDEIVRGWRPALYLSFVLPGFSPTW